MEAMDMHKAYVTSIWTHLIICRWEKSSFPIIYMDTFLIPPSGLRQFTYFSLFWDDLSRRLYTDMAS